MSVTREQSETIVSKIEEDILDRRGLKHELYACDEYVRQEIRDAWIEIIEEVIG